MVCGAARCPSSASELLFRELDESNQEFADGDKQALQAGLKNCAFQFSNNYDPKAAQNLTLGEV